MAELRNHEMVVAYGHGRTGKYEPGSGSTAKDPKRIIPGKAAAGSNQIQRVCHLRRETAQSTRAGEPSK